MVNGQHGISPHESGQFRLLTLVLRNDSLLLVDRSYLLLHRQTRIEPLVLTDNSSKAHLFRSRSAFNLPLVLFQTAFNNDA